MASLLIPCLATSLSSMVMSVDHPGLTFNLTSLRSEPTYNQPVQQWTFTSDFAVRSAEWNSDTRWTCLCVVYVLCFSLQVRDYSGTYTVKLIPCTTAQNMEYTVPPICSPREPITFDLDIRFQQVREHRFKLKYPELVLLLEVFISFSWAFMMNSFVGERPGCYWVQSEHSDVLAVQENLVALRRVNGVRSREWCGLFWGSVTFFTCISKTRLDVLHTQVKSVFFLQSRWYGLWPCDGGPCSEPRRLFLLQYRESVPLHRHRWICSKIQPDQVWVWLPGRLPLIALQI